MIITQLRTMQILNPAETGDRASAICDAIVTAMVLANIAVITAESVAELDADYHGFFTGFEVFSVTFFTAEFLLRLWAAGARFGPGRAWDGRKNYLFGFYGIVDFLAIAPFYLQVLMPGLDLRILRAVRLIRLLKISHYSSALEDLFEAIKAERRAFGATLYLLAIALTLSSTLMYFAENEAQPEKFASIPLAMYWSAITLTTVGYGDVSPVTVLGKAISVFTAFMGVSTVAMLTGIIASSFADQLSRRRVIFESQLRRAYEDGEIDAREAEALDRLKERFDLSDEQVEQMRIKVERESQGL